MFDNANKRINNPFVSLQTYSVVCGFVVTCSFLQSCVFAHKQIQFACLLVYVFVCSLVCLFVRQHGVVGCKQTCL